ncbi:hypothetical protein ACWC91_30350, partial [Streptomyces sp. NPDC001204]
MMTTSRRRARTARVLHSRTRSLPRPFVDHLRALAAQERQDRIVVLIPEMHLPRPWQRLLQNQRGAVLDRAVRGFCRTSAVPSWTAPSAASAEPARCCPGPRRPRLLQNQRGAVLDRAVRGFCRTSAVL